MRAEGRSARYRIVMLIDGLGSGGAQRQFTYLSCGLARRGHDVAVAVYNDQDHYADAITSAGIPIARLPKPSRFSFRPVFALVKLYQDRRAQAVVAFLRSPAAKAELARLLDPAINVIAAERSVYPEPRLPLLLRLTHGLHRLATFITTNSQHQLIRMKRLSPGSARRMTCIANAIPLPANVAAVRPRVAENLRILAISSLMPKKHSVMVAEALALLRDEYGITASVSWLGETFAHLGEYGAYRETCATIARLDLADQWTWLGAQKNVDDFLLAHDVLLHSSSVEGSSNAVCEAMAIGLPVIAGSIADHASLLEETGAGLLFESHTPRSIAATVARFSQLDAETRAAMGKAGRSIIETEFAEARMVDHYEALIAASIAGRGIPRELTGQEDLRACAV
ncbi:glycosyltransferase [Tsuneonella troitsensis]|uniref:glycosyltransferase n=1 Tax=Tsuneonella troitsensis TaxID=292222 RepID=UPI00137A65B9|nr:glycosyltransferase [Tsuneonella troitsensis]